MYTLYPDVSQKIENIIKKLELNLCSKGVKDFIKEKRRFYHAVVKTKGGKKAFFKTLLGKEVGIKNRFLNEIKFLKTLRENPKHPLSELVPKIFKYSLNPSFPYLLEEFLPGKSKKREDKFSKEEIKKIVELIKLINSSGIIFNFVPKKPLFNFSFYKEKIFFYFKKIEIKFKIKEKIKNFINRNQKIFYKAKPKLTHGDFSEANLIFFKDKIKITDWEHVHLRNPLHDLAGFWIKRRNYPKEQEILIKEYLKKGDLFFPPLFKLALIENALQDLMLFQKILKSSKNKKVKREEREILELIEKGI